MDIELNTLLVAMMYVTILSMGIGNILVVLADIFNHATAARRDRIHISWIFLLLLVHFDLFWHTKALLDVDNWQFGGFLLTIAGPVLVFFATSILLTTPPENEKTDLGHFFLNLSRRFFTLLVIVQLWIISVDYSIAGHLAKVSYINGLFAVLATFLAITNNRKAKAVGIWMAGGLVITSFVLEWLN